MLGVILAGGRSSRFGSDKALAMIDGRPMLEHVAERLREQCAAVAVAGREWPGLIAVSDRPEPGLGPLGGLAGALTYGRNEGFDAVLSSSCDLPALPADLLDLLGAPDAILQRQPTIGLWSTVHADGLVAHLASGRPRSIRAWADTTDASTIPWGDGLANINTPEDLAAFSRSARPRSSR